MEIQVNSDKNIAVDSRLALFVRGEAGRALERFKDKLTRVEFHLSDVNGPKFGTRDKRCLVEARPARHRPLVARATAATVRSAIEMSLSKLRSALETFYGRLRTSRTTTRTRTESQSALPLVADTRARPTKRTAAKKVAVKKAASNQPASKQLASKQPASSERGPKKQGIYRARRKAWPKR
jgi:hypothetical protein